MEKAEQNRSEYLRIQYEAAQLGHLFLHVCKRWTSVPIERSAGHRRGGEEMVRETAYHPLRPCNCALFSGRVYIIQNIRISISRLTYFT